MKNKFKKYTNYSIYCSHFICVTILITFVLGMVPVNADEPQGHIVQFDDFSYNPSHLDVTVGDTIIWIGNFLSHPLQSTVIPDGATSWGPIVSGTEFRYVVEVEGTYHYECTAHANDLDMTGSFMATVTSIEKYEKDIPASFQLHQNYPNPFNPSTVIVFSIPELQRVNLTVYDIIGKEIAILLNNEELSAGTYRIQFNAEKLPSGIYLYRLTAGDFQQVRRMILIR